MLLNKVREAIERNQSGSIHVSRDGRSCTYECLKEFEAAVKVASAKAVTKGKYGFGFRDIELNSDTGEVTPMTALGWEVLESMNAESAYDLKVNGQSAAYASSCFHGLIDVEHDHVEIRQEQLQTEQDRAFAGYGSSTMGGWVE